MAVINALSTRGEHERLRSPAARIRVLNWLFFAATG
jgi:hypothetical protein